MRIFHALTAALLPLAALAAAKDSDNRFNAVWGKQALPMKLDDAKFSKMTKAPRDYALAVVLTALEARFGCEMCQTFKPEWEILTKSWVKGDKAGDSRVLFGTLDFVDGKGTFQSLGLQHAPILLLYPPTVGPNAKPHGEPARFDFTAGPQNADSAHAWLTRQLPDGPHPPLVRPTNWFKIIATTTALLGTVSLVTVAAPYIMPLIQNRNLWAAFSLIAVLLFTSGHMFNHIRKVPYVSGDGKGGITYFAGGFQSQYGMETQIVAAVYGALAFSTIFLAIKVPRLANPQKQQFQVLAWLGIQFVVYSFLLSIFRIKNGGYPFWLPPF